MSRLALGWVVLLMTTGSVLAGSSAPYRSNPTYYFAAPTYQAQNSSERLALHMGASAQRFWKSGFGWTAEAGYLSPKNKIFQGGNATISAGLVHRIYARGAINGFLGAGYTGMNVSGVSHFGHFSGGIDVWGGGRWGVRFETRALLYEMSDFSFLEFRIGILH